MTVLYEDTLQQKHHGDKHKLKHDWWAAHGVEVVRCRFDGKHEAPFSYGDYGVDGANVVIDTKASLAEVAANLGRDHSRFKREVMRANDDGCLLIVLVETNEAETLEDVKRWCNTHCIKCKHRGKPCEPRDRDEICIRHGTKKPLQGDTIAKQMATMQVNRFVRFEFVRPEESARRICEILGVRYEQNAAGSAETARAGIQDTPNQAGD